MSNVVKVATGQYAAETKWKVVFSESHILTGTITAFREGIYFLDQGTSRHYFDACSVLSLSPIRTKAK